MDYLIDARPVAVSADGTAVAGYDHENIAYITVHFDNGFLAHFHVNWLAPVKIRHMLIGGSQRMLVFNDMEPSEKVLVYDKGVDLNVNVQDDQARRQILVSYRTGDMHAPKLDRTEALAARRAGVCRRHRDEADAADRRRVRHPRRVAARGRRAVTALGRTAGPHMKFQNIAPDVKLGRDVKIYDFVNLYGCEIGDESKIGAFVEIQKGARIGKRVKISSHTFICEGVTIEDQVFIGHNVTFINDLYPRATTPLGELQATADWEVVPTFVRKGASIGSGT